MTTQRERLTSQDFPSLSVALIIFNATTSLESGSFAFHTWRTKWPNEDAFDARALGIFQTKCYQSAEPRVIKRSLGLAHTPRQNTRSDHIAHAVPIEYIEWTHRFAHFSVIFIVTLTFTSGNMSYRHYAMSPVSHPQYAVHNELQLA